jgi:large subunit ribosomal protein L24
MSKLKKGDTIQVTKGKDRGKKGKILYFVPQKNKAIVEGINLVKKYMRRNQQNPQGGIVSIESPISVTNIMFFCKTCSRPVKIGFSIAGDGGKSRICKICKETL